MSQTISFLGAAGTVTGSKFLLEARSKRLLVDCGLFQGLKTLRLRNWRAFPVPPPSVDAVVLTHAHLDHTGYLPLLVRNGYSGPVFCSRATAALCGLLLPDSGFLQEKDAEFANRHGLSKHRPAMPLYTEADARRALEHLQAVPFEQAERLPVGADITLRRTGHILGAASVQLDWDGTTIVFSGDLGRYGDPLLHDPTPVPRADYLVVESTYGNRRHARVDPQAVLGQVVEETTGRGGTVIVPAFAVGRAQALLFHLHALKSSGRLANVPVFLDSPMATDASNLFCDSLEDHRLPAGACRAAFGSARYVRSVDESKALTANPMPKVIISASGMATGGRVLHHLKRYAPDRRSTILLAGFQAPGTRGAALVDGAETIKIHGEHIPVRAEVRRIDAMSAHGDADEILRWLRGFATPPRRTFITHGEPAATDALRQRIEEQLGWAVTIPADGEQIALS